VKVSVYRLKTHALGLARVVDTAPRNSLASQDAASQLASLSKESLRVNSVDKRFVPDLIALISSSEYNLLQLRLAL